MQHINVNEMIPGALIVRGDYLIQTNQIATSKTGSNYLTGMLTDETGSIEFKHWNYPGRSFPAGQAVYVEGTVSSFGNKNNLILTCIRPSDPQTDLTALVPKAPIDVAEYDDQLRTLLKQIQDKDYKKLVFVFYQNHHQEILDTPAAKSIHHAFLHGLLMHTGNMLKLADFLAGLYGDLVDRDLLLTGTFAHDLQKETEFVFSQLGLVTGYSARGQLLGHLVMGAQEAAEVARQVNMPEEKSVLLQHLILSHHGEPEFGAAVVPMCPEGELLSLIDKLDSRMEIYREELEKLQPGEVSRRIFALDKRIYRRAD